MLSEPASLRTETPGEEKAGKPCCYALPVGTRPRLKQISHKNVKHWVMAEYHMYRTFTTRSLLLSVPPRATTLQSPLQPAPLETEKSLERTRQATQLRLPLAYAKSLSPFKFQPHFIFQTENRVQARTFLYVQHLLLFPRYQTRLTDQSQKTCSILQLSTPLWSHEQVALRQQQISQSASSCASCSSVFIKMIR